MNDRASDRILDRPILTLEVTFPACRSGDGMQDIPERTWAKQWSIRDVADAPRWAAPQKQSLYEIPDWLINRTRSWENPGDPIVLRGEVAKDRWEDACGELTDHELQGGMGSACICGKNHL